MQCSNGENGSDLPHPPGAGDPHRPADALRLPTDSVFGARPDRWSRPGSPRFPPCSDTGRSEDRCRRGRAAPERGSSPSTGAPPRSGDARRRLCSPGVHGRRMGSVAGVAVSCAARSDVGGRPSRAARPSPTVLTSRCCPRPSSSFVLCDNPGPRPSRGSVCVAHSGTTQYVNRLGFDAASLLGRGCTSCPSVTPPSSVSER